MEQITFDFNRKNIKENDVITCAGIDFVIQTVLKQTVVARNPRTNDTHELAISDIEPKRYYSDE